MTRQYVFGRTCSLEDCDKPHKGNGYCHTHNALFKRNGTPHRLPPRVPATCAVDGCERDERGMQGYCEAHLVRVKRNGADNVTADIRDLRTRAYEPGTVCEIDGCDKPVESRGWCRAHYKKWFKYGDPTVVRNKRVVISDGCKNCTTCDRVLPLEEFYRNPIHTSGLDYACKDCMAARSNGGITVAELRERDGDLCYLCDRLMSFRRSRIGNYNPRRASIEHVIPRARGGEHTLDNVKLACLRCNIRKNDKDPQALADVEWST
jgi:hypothetical protein